GLAVFAEHQSAGRGQYGRRWSAPPRSSLLFSLALRPTAERVDPRFLTAWSAVGVAETVDALYGLPARIKWPNDVLVDGRKIAGILVERPNLNDAEAVVVGVGLNVNIPSSSFPADLRQPAASVWSALGTPVDRSRLAAALLNRLDDLLGAAADAGPENLLKRWRERSNVAVGRTVRVDGRETELFGVLLGLDPFAGVRVLRPGGFPATMAAVDVLRVEPTRP
ncbi:MAG: biotin--[acetyl-CoA-carboxylase] ligase, partial [Planctomycetia bacterium]